MIQFTARRRVPTALLMAVPLVLFTGVSFAAEPKLESITPSAFRVGETKVVKILGEGMESARELVFYQDGIECLEIMADDNFEATAKIRVDKDAKVGSAACRLLTADGFSNVKTLRLTDLPLIIEPERVSEEAPISLEYGSGIAVYGTLESGQYDQYALELNEGDPCTVVVDAVRLGGNLLDTVLKVYSPTGQLIAFVDDTSLYRQDPYLRFVAKDAGQYIIEVHETNYDGSDGSHYLLYVGDMPAPAILYPPGGQVGQTLEATTISEDFAKSESEIFQLEPLEASVDGWFDYRLERDGKRAPTGIRMRVSSFPNILESELNNDVKSVLGEVNSIPAAFCGIIETSGDVDCFAFHADAGTSVRFESFAQRLGAPIDTLIFITDDEGNILVSGDDWMCHDSLFDFKPKRSGTYVLHVTDKLGDGYPNGVYRVEATFTKPTITAFLPRPERTTQAGQSVAIPQGNRALVNIAVRRELIEGDAQVNFGNLPAGVEISSTTIPADQYWMPTIASADKSAKIGGKLASTVVSINAGEETITGGFTQAIDLVAGTADTLFYGVDVRRIPVAVVDPIPFKVELENPKTSLAFGGTFALKIRAEREPGFDEPLIIKLPFLPPWVTCEPEALIPAGVTEIEHLLTADLQAENRVWPMVVTAEVDVKNASADMSNLRGKQVASQLVDLVIDASPITGRFEPIAAEQGQQIEIICACTVTGPIPQRMEAILEGLPNRVTCEPVILEGETAEIVFALKLAVDAPVGTFKSLACRLSGQLEGQPVSYVVAHETVLQIAEPGKLVRGSSGELLSPLEALRQKNLRP